MILPAASPMRVMPMITQTIPTDLPNTNPPSSHRITAAMIEITRVRVLGFIYKPFLSIITSSDFAIAENEE